MFVLRAWGPFALWTPVGLRAERSTMTIGSHEAWKGFLRRIYGKWIVDYTVHKVEIVKRGTKFVSTSNELKFNSVGLHPIDTRVGAGQHTQRTTVFLRDVEYLIHFDVKLDEVRARPGIDTSEKVYEMAKRRFKQGQRERTSCFGIRECTAHWELVENRSSLPPVEPFDEDLGITFYGTDWHNGADNYFAPLKIEKGIVHYPTWDEVRAFGLSKPLSRAS